MPAAAWEFSDWRLSLEGTSLRFTRFQLHLREVTDAIKRGNYSVEGKSRDQDIVQRYLADLMKAEKYETSIAPAATTGAHRVSFTRGRIIN